MSTRPALRPKPAWLAATSSSRSIGQAVTSIDDVKSALDKAGDKPVLLLVSRRRADDLLTVSPTSGLDSSNKRP